MRKLLIFLLLLFSISTVEATINLNQSATLANVIYENETVETIQLNISDVLVYTKIDSTIRQFPTTITYALQDKNNNTLKINYVYSKESGWVFHRITRSVKAEYNNIPVVFSGNVTNIIQSYNDVEILSSEYYFKQIFAFNPTDFIIPSFVSFTGGGDKYTHINNFYPNKLIIPTVSNTYENTYISIKYTKLIKALTIAGIDETYGGLNPVFKMIFLVYKTGIKIVDVLSLGTAFSDADMINYQTYLLEPLKMLDVMVDLIFDTIAFFMAMGIIASFVIIECIIFIFTYATNRRSMLTVISMTIEKSITVWTTIIINPIIWFYDNMLLKIIGK